MNTFRIARTLGEHVVAIIAEHSERGLYGMRIMVDGELWGYRQSENVIAHGKIKLQELQPDASRNSVASKGESFFEKTRIWPPNHSRH